MSSPAATYVQGVHEKLKLFAAWPPNQPRKLGDVGRLVDGEFEFLTTLENLGIKFSQRVGPPGEDLSYTSGSSVSVQFKAEGQTLPGASIPQANAGVLVEFGASGAFVIQVAGPVLSQIDDIVSLGKQISTLFRTTDSGKRQWEESWCVITELLTASKLTVLISRSATSKVELSAEAKIPIGSKAPLANVGGKLSVVSQKGEVT